MRRAAFQRIIEHMPAQPVSAAAALAAVRAVFRRRAAREDPDLGSFPDPDDVDDVLRVLAYMAARQRVRDADGSLHRAEALDALTLAGYLRTRADELTVRYVAAARARKVPWARLAPYLGVTSPQGAEQAFLRLKSALAGEAADAQLVRADRARERVIRAAASSGVQIRDLLLRLADVNVGLPPDLDADAEVLWEALAALPPDSEPDVAVVSALRYLVRQMRGRDDLSPTAAALAADAMTVLGIKPLPTPPP